MDRGTAAGLQGMLCVLLLYCCYPYTAAVGEEAYSDVNFPDPGNSSEWAACGVQNYSYICDPSNSLNESDLNRLNTLIRSLRNVESCVCDKDGPCHKEHNHIIKVALVPRIKYAMGRFPTTNSSEINAVRSFAEHLRDKEWKLYTDMGCPIEVLVVLDLHTKRIWTATNYFAKKVITDERAEAVGLGAKDKYFKQDMIYFGLDDMITKYKQFLEVFRPDHSSNDSGQTNTFSNQARPKSGLAWWQILFIVLNSLFVIGELLILCARIRFGIWGEGGGFTGGVWNGDWSGGGGGGCGGGCSGGGCGGGGGG